MRLKPFLYEMSEDVKKRFVAEMKKLGILLTAGILYAIWCSLTGLGIPCVFRLLLGIKCPGCGMTHAAVAMTHLDVAEAFRCNKLSVTIVPLLAVMLLVQEIRYIRTGSRKINIPETVALTIMLALTVVYGILRNLPAQTLEELIRIFPQSLRLG